MISRIYRLVDTKRIEMVQREIAPEQGHVLARPDYMSICAADQRYYLGRRKKEILSSKLPMALIHEATATVLYDGSHTLPSGSKVVLLPLAHKEDDDTGIKANYRQDSVFASSGADGFMRDLVALPRRGVLPIAEADSLLYVFSELVSVALNAIEAFELSRRIPGQSFGVWGDGSMGYMMSLALRCAFPGSNIYVFGKNARKLQKFSFVSDTFYIDRMPAGLTLHHCFECVGNGGSEAALSQIINAISPQGCIGLLGVSEDAIPIDTRAILEKGLQLSGTSRSDYSDFSKAVRLIRENEICRRYLRMLISEIVDVKCEGDIPRAFEQDVLNDFKTVIRWLM